MKGGVDEGLPGSGCLRTSLPEDRPPPPPGAALGRVEEETSKYRGDKKNGECGSKFKTLTI